MRLVVTGKSGQIATAVIERGTLHDVDILPIGRPELDLANAGNAQAILADLAPDLIVSAAAYTAVDKAETEPETAWAINARGAGQLAKVAAALGVPIIHLSTDYVFDGLKPAPYVESDETAPLGVYGASKLAGEQSVVAANGKHVILRTAWVYSPFGSNFLKTVLRLAEEQRELLVVDDQFGNPTSALDIADAIIAVARNLVAHPDDASLRGIFHMAGTGDGSWADFATEIFTSSRRQGGPTSLVSRITTAEYVASAKRPANSRLSSGLLASVHGVVMPDWRGSTEEAVRRLTA